MMSNSGQSGHSGQEPMEQNLLNEESSSMQQNLLNEDGQENDPQRNQEDYYECGNMGDTNNSNHLNDAFQYIPTMTSGVSDEMQQIDLHDIDTDDLISENPSSQQTDQATVAAVCSPMPSLLLMQEEDEESQRRSQAPPEGLDEFDISDTNFSESDNEYSTASSVSS